MRKILSGLIALCLVSGVALAAEVPGEAMKAVRDIQKGVNNKNQIIDLRVQDDAVIGGDVTIGGSLAANGGTTITNISAASLTAGSSLTAVNGASITNLSATGFSASSAGAVTNVLTGIGYTATVVRVGRTILTWTQAGPWVWYWGWVPEVPGPANFASFLAGFRGLKTPKR